MKLAVVSNFDTRLRPLMKAMECHDWFDALAISAEVEMLECLMYTRVELPNALDSTEHP